jgi:L-threonylcarbamoyladenylate synthase
MQVATDILTASEPQLIERAAALLRLDELVAFPTETVYGLAANGISAEAVAKIFAAKGRPADNPLILHVASIEQALLLWQASSLQIQRARALAAVHWPGALSLVLPAAKFIPTEVTAGLDSVAIRAPAHPIAQALLLQCEFPLAAPSANLSGRPSPTTASHVQKTLGGRITAILDGGPTSVGIESTVLDLRPEQPRILRHGGISASSIEQVIGSLNKLKSPADAASPGLRHHHYQPIGIKIELLDAESISDLWDSVSGIACWPELASQLEGRVAPLWVLPDSAAKYAAVLYKTLYQIEESDVSKVLVELPPENGEWAAILDRLRRAAGKES